MGYLRPEFLKFQFLGNFFKVNLEDPRDTYSLLKGLGVRCETMSTTRRRFVILNEHTGQRIFHFSGKNILSSWTFPKLVGVCLTRHIDVCHLQFLVELPVRQSSVIRRNTAKLIQEIKESLLPQCRITTREFQVLRGVIKGLRNKEIADELHISERTIKFHVSRLLEKYKVRGRSELAHEGAVDFNRHAITMKA